MNDELKQNNWQEQSIKEMIQKNEEMSEILKHQLDIIEYENAVDSDLVAFASKYLNGQNKENNYVEYQIGNVSNRAKEDILKLAKINTSNYSHVIKPNAIRHIERRHGENGQQDKSMKNVEDIARVGYVLENYDELSLLMERSSGFNNKDNAPALLVQYKKRINGNFYIVEALTDTKSSRLQITSMYQEKVKEQKKEEYALNAETLRTTPEAVHTLSTKSIPQAPKKVKKNNKNNNKDIER